MKKSDFKGLAKAAQDFDKFTILGSMRDPGWGYEHVFLLRIRFEDGAEGLCIWDSRAEAFIEEPGDYEQYDLTREKVQAKYPAIFKK